MTEETGERREVVKGLLEAEVGDEVVLPFGYVKLVSKYLGLTPDELPVFEVGVEGNRGRFYLAPNGYFIHYKGEVAQYED